MRYALTSFIALRLQALVIAALLSPTLIGCVTGPGSDNLRQVFRQGSELYTAKRYDEAEPPLIRAMELATVNYGPLHPWVPATIYTLGILYQVQGRYADAEPLLKRALAIREKMLGPDHPDVASDLYNLANMYRTQARYVDAEPLYKRSLEIREKAKGPDYPNVAFTLNNLANLYKAQARYAASEPLYKRSLAIREEALGPNHASVGMALNNLGLLYKAQGRYADAEPLLKRSLTIREKNLGHDHPDVASTLNNLGLLYYDQGRYIDAEPLYKRSLAIMEKALGPDHFKLASTLNNLAVMYRAQGRFADAEPLLKRSLAIKENMLGLDHPYLVSTLMSLALLNEEQDRYADAELLIKRALAITEKALGPDHPNVTLALSILALVYIDQERHEAALASIRHASGILLDRAAGYGGQLSGAGLSEQRKFRGVFLGHALVIGEELARQPAEKGSLIAEGFEAGQLALATGTAAAVAGLGARFGAGDDDLALLARARQDAVEEWQRLDKALIDAAGKPPEKRDRLTEARQRERLAALDRHLGDLDGQMSDDFPEYKELASPLPLPLAEAQALLAGDEALLVFAVWGDEQLLVLAPSNENRLQMEKTLLWVVRRDRAEMHTLDIGHDALEEAVKDLRAGLDSTGLSSLSDIPAFDTTKAFQLYNQIFATAEPLLEGIKHLFMVPDGPLQSLPLGVLVTKETVGDFMDFSGYRQVPWLAKKYAMTTLPSVSSLRALRRFAKSAQANNPFGGIGDPLLQGHPGERRSIKLASLFTSRGIADVNAVRTRLAPLPETADELEAISRILGGGKADLFLRERATESRIKTEALNKYRVLAFATHGLVAGDLEGLAEPALVLTPPNVGTEEDDGLLTASEVATLKLNADMVVLSACNTASADGSPEAEALSGLAKAFFYAGSRSLLVSHWPVFSDAAVNLTTTMLKEVANDNTIGRAEALRRSMLALMETPGKPYYAHPMFWAPFVVVG